MQGNQTSVSEVQVKAPVIPKYTSAQKEWLQQVRGLATGGLLMGPAPIVFYKGNEPMTAARSKEMVQQSDDFDEDPKVLKELAEEQRSVNRKIKSKTGKTKKSKTGDTEEQKFKERYAASNAKEAADLEKMMKRYKKEYPTQ